MLLGTTFAWFTDSVTSSGNIIKSGTLNVEMYYAEGTEDPASVAWTDASTGAIFDYDKWEPGYVEVRHIKIANEGSLALKYKLSIIANGEVSDLSDVIDVYYVDPAVQVSDRAQLTDANKLGTLTEVLANLANTANGELTAGENDTITLALKMREDVGNDYQNKSIGASFSVQLLATQLTSENDSFGNQYDKDAVYDAYVTNADELVDAIANGGVVALMNDIELTDSVAVETDATIDLNGYTVSNTETTPFVVGQESAAVFTVKDSSTDGTGAIVASNNYTNSNDAVCPVVVHYGEFVLESGTLTGYAGVRGKENKTDKITIKGGTINADNIGVYARTAMISIEGGTINAGYGVTAQGTIFISGGTINAKHYGYSSSGNYDNTTVVISGDAVINSEYMGIYWPSGGSLTIDGGTITGETGVHFKSGTLNITGGTLIGTGEKKDYYFYDNGSVNTGDALMIENVGLGAGETSGYEAITSVSITGGTFQSTNSYAVSSYDAGVNDAVDAVTGFIIGGTFSTDVSSLVADGYVATESNGSWTVVKN